MNIFEYHMYEAERCDNGEIVRGDKINILCDFYIVNHDINYNAYLVKHETLRRVAVKPIEAKSYETCPNCGSYNISFMRTNDLYGEPPEPFDCDYCPDCGQRLER